MTAGAPLNNKNAEKWNLENATELLMKCLVTSADRTLDCNDFIGEVAQENGTSHKILTYLTEKYPELTHILEEIKTNCEANCFRNAKKGTIVPSLGIINLKSNHGWKDTHSVVQHNTNINSEPLSTEEIKRISKELDDEY